MDRWETMCVIVLVLAGALASPSVADPVTLPFEEGFEPAAADDWFSLSSAKPPSVVEGIFFTGTKSLRLDSLPWASTVQCIALDEVPDRLSYEAAVSVDASNGRRAIVGSVNGYGSAVVMWNFFCIDGESGTIHFCGDDMVSFDGLTYTGDAWCVVRADLNYETTTADLRVMCGDDEARAEDVPITPKEVTNQWGVGAPATSAFSNVVYFDALKVWESETTLTVDVDVKPSGNPNTINLRSKGLVPVCVFSSDTFDATQIDPTSCDFAGAPVAVRADGTNMMADTEDIDGDGLTDMVLHFETQLLDPEQIQDGYAVLVGSTLDGQEFLGLDEVVLIARPSSLRGRR